MPGFDGPKGQIIRCLIRSGSESDTTVHVQHQSRVTGEVVFDCISLAGSSSRLIIKLLESNKLIAILQDNELGHYKTFLSCNAHLTMYSGGLNKQTHNKVYARIEDPRSERYADLEGSKAITEVDHQVTILFLFATGSEAASVCQAFPTRIQQLAGR